MYQAMYLASPYWAKLLTKFIPKFKILNMFWTWSLSKEKTKQLIFSIGFQIFNFKTENLVISNATKNLQSMIQMALK